MPNIRGFIEAIEVSRAGLVRVFLIHADGTRGTYIIRDLDADPERFNERLSKLAIARDAQDRAEPVEIEHVPGPSGNEIERIRRISRADLAIVGRVEAVSGFIFDLMVHAESGITSAGEKQDVAAVFILTPDMSVQRLVLFLQAPERLVVNEQLEMLRDAQARGRVVRLLVNRGGPQKAEARPDSIIAVAVDNADNDFGGERAQEVDGFVESISLLRLPFSVGGTSITSSFAHVRFTTAPPFTGAGNVVGLAEFTPKLINLLVMKNSLAYELFLAGLRDNLRMRASTIMVPKRDRSPAREDTGAAALQQGLKSEGVNTVKETVDAATTGSAGATHTAVLRMLSAMKSAAATSEGQQESTLFISFGAELLAPLASASRPVWIEIKRESLDIGPDKAYCVSGTPSSDLTPQGLRNLRIPYPAVWRGLACFNHGVYRFQLKLPLPFKLIVDGKELCLHDSDPAGSKLAHACLHDACEVVVEIEHWTCDSEFIMDVYRLR